MKSICESRTNVKCECAILELSQELEISSRCESIYVNLDELSSVYEIMMTISMTNLEV